jgi:hypothetical protein
MKTETIRELIREGALLVAPVRPRNVRDIPRIRAALGAR